jgi:hypothetical protein
MVPRTVARARARRALRRDGTAGTLASGRRGRAYFERTRRRSSAHALLSVIDDSLAEAAAGKVEDFSAFCRHSAST